MYSQLIKGDLDSQKEKAQEQKEKQLVKNDSQKKELESLRVESLSLQSKVKRYKQLLEDLKKQKAPQS